MSTFIPLQDGIGSAAIRCDYCGVEHEVNFRITDSSIEIWETNASCIIIPLVQLLNDYETENSGASPNTLNREDSDGGSDRPLSEGSGSSDQEVL